LMTLSELITWQIFQESPISKTNTTKTLTDWYQELDNWLIKGNPNWTEKQLIKLEKSIRPQPQQPLIMVSRLPRQSSYVWWLLMILLRRLMPVRRKHSKHRLKLMKLPSRVKQHSRLLLRRQEIDWRKPMKTHKN
jgi:hypothetical protein